MGWFKKDKKSSEEAEWHGEMPPRSPERALECAYRVLDRLILLAPLDWTRIRLQYAATRRDEAFENSLYICRVDSVEYELGGDEPAVDFSPIEPGLATAHLGSALGYLLTQTHGSESSEINLGLVCIRNEKGRIVLKTVDEAVLPKFFELKQSDLTFTPELLQLMHERIAEDWQDQVDFNLRVEKADQVSYSRSTSCLTFGSPDGEPLELPFQTIGSHSTEYNSWCWSWANRSWAEDPHTIEEVVALRTDASGPAMRLLRTPGFDSDPVFSTAVARFAARRLGTALYAWNKPEEKIIIYFSVRDAKRA